MHRARRRTTVAVALVGALVAATLSACSYTTEVTLPDSDPQSSRILWSDGTTLALLHDEQNREDVPLAEMGETLPTAVVAIVTVATVPTAVIAVTALTTVVALTTVGLLGALLALLPVALGAVGLLGRLGGAGLTAGRAAPAALGGADSGDEFGLAHGASTLDAQARGGRLQLGEQHRIQALGRGCSIGHVSWCP